MLASLSSLFPTIHTVTKGVVTGTAFAYNKHLEDSVRVGRNAYFTGILQAAEVDLARTLAISAIFAVTKRSLGGIAFIITGIVCFIFPLILAFIIKQEYITNSTVRNILIFAQDHLGDLAEIVSLVSCVALICFGNVLLGASALGFFAIGFMAQKGYLPTRVRQLFNKTFWPIFIIGGLVAGTLLNRIYSVAFLVFGTAKYFSCSCFEPSQETRGQPIKPHNLSLRDFIKGMNPDLDSTRVYPVNPTYAAQNTKPPAPNIKIGELRHLFEQIKVCKYADDQDEEVVEELFTNSFSSIECFRYLYNQGKRPTAQQIMAYLRDPSSTTPGESYTVLFATNAEEFHTLQRSHQRSRDIEGMRDVLTNYRDARFSEWCQQHSRLSLEEQTVTYVCHLLDKVDEVANLRASLNDDARFNELFKDHKQKPSANEVVNYIKSRLNTFISSIENRKILEGEPISYDDLEYFVKCITYALQEKLKKAQQINMKSDAKPEERIQALEDLNCVSNFLCTLAIEGGEYCGSGKFGVAETLYAQIVHSLPKISPRLKVLNVLQDARHYLLESMITLMITMSKNMAETNRLLIINKWILKGVGTSDRHLFNQMVNIFIGKSFYARTSAAENDSISTVDPLMEALFQYFFGTKFIIKKLWEEHENDMVNAIVDAVGTPRLSVMDFLIYWKECIENMPDLQEDKKTELLSQFSEGGIGYFTDSSGETIAFKQFDPGNRELIQRMALVMLFDIGAFKTNALSHPGPAMTLSDGLKARNAEFLKQIREKQALAVTHA